MLNLHNYFVKRDCLSEEMVLIAEKIRGSKNHDSSLLLEKTSKTS